MKKIFNSSNHDDTEKIGEQLGRKLKGGEVIELNSDLGGGKTTFVRGLAKGIGSDNAVASPTFTISRVYDGDKLTIYHFDFYRLNDAGLMRHELADVINNPKIVVVSEWAEIVDDVLPEDRLIIEFKHQAESSRKIIFNYPPSLAYLV